MAERNPLEAEFEAHRTHLRAVAYRMLGSLSEADDAVQEAWLRLSRADAERDREPRRLADDGRRAASASNMLRARSDARARSRSTSTCPTRSSTAPTAADPEHEALLADSVGLALLVVLETLAPAERLAFVLHDMFGVPFDEIAPIVDRSPEAPASSPAAPAGGCGAPAPEPDADLAAPARGRRRVPRRRARGRLRRAARGARPRHRPSRRRRRRPSGGLDRGPRGRERRLAGAAVRGQCAVRTARGRQRRRRDARGARRAPAVARRSRSAAGASSRSTSSPTRSGCGRSWPSSASYARSL